MAHSIPKVFLVCGILFLAAVEHLEPNPFGSPDAGHYLPELPRGLQDFLPVPPGNPLTSAKVELGRQLFFETQLSLDGSVSCASCHEPAAGYSDARSLPVGIRGLQGRRNAPSLLNVGYRGPLFWDGRVRTLEEQVIEVVINPVEFGTTPEEVVDRLRKSPFHRQLYLSAFGTEQITIKGVARAMASFERNLRPGLRSGWQGGPASLRSAGTGGRQRVPGELQCRRTPAVPPDSNGWGRRFRHRLAQQRGWRRNPCPALFASLTSLFDFK